MRIPALTLRAEREDFLAEIEPHDRVECRADKPHESLILREKRPQTLSLRAEGVLGRDFATFPQGASKPFHTSLAVFDDVRGGEFCNVFRVDYCNTPCLRREGLA